MLWVDGKAPAGETAAGEAAVGEARTSACIDAGGGINGDRSPRVGQILGQQRWVGRTRKSMEKSPDHGVQRGGGDGQRRS